MAIFYHGSSVLFDKFDLAHVLKGAGKVKFGYGLYLTSSYPSASHYSGADKSAENHFVYTVEVPDLTDSNHIDFKQPVHSDIITKTERALNISIPEKIKGDGKEFRKFLANHFERDLLNNLTENHSQDKSVHFLGEQAASEFLSSIGVCFITWPYSWKNPGLGLNVAVLNQDNVKIKRIDRIELDSKQKLIKGSEREVKI